MSLIDAYVSRVLAAAGLAAGDSQGEELRAHLEDLAAEYKQAGMNPEEAVGQALAGFGDATAIGLKLRETIPLPVSGREWQLLAAGGALAGLLFWIQSVFGWHEPFDWLPLVAIIGGVLAVATRQPLLGALAPAGGILLARAVSGLFVSGGLGGQPIRLDGHIFWMAMRSQALLAEGLFLVAVGLLVGLVVAKRRRQGVLVPRADWVVAGLGHLLPFLIVYGLSRGALGVVAAVVLWYVSRERSPFVARHARQAAVISMGAVATQFLAYRYNVLWYPGPEFAVPVYVSAVGLGAVRLGFGLVAVYASLSAILGHDFRYPLVGRLFRRGRWLHLRQV